MLEALQDRVVSVSAKPVCIWVLYRVCKSRHTHLKEKKERMIECEGEFIARIVLYSFRPTFSSYVINAQKITLECWN